MGYGLADDMSESKAIRERIQARISQGEFLAGMLRTARHESEEVQRDFVDRLSEIATVVRELLENNNLICALNYRPQVYWPTVTGRRYAFVDGGVANIELPSAAPIGVRVGSYIVRPGDETDDREQFNIELSLVDDLYSNEGVVFDDDFLDLPKLRDASRIISEVAVGLRLATLEEPALDAILLHGPLVNPVAPYGLEDFPPFTLEAARKFLCDAQWAGDETSRAFVALYLEVLEDLKASGRAVVGVVERSIGRYPVVIDRILNQLTDQDVLRKEHAKEIEQKLQAYGLNDASLLDIVLQDGEYIKPIPVNRQGPENKWPEGWKKWIRTYPEALTTYIKPSALVTPFRVEAFVDIPDFAAVLDLVLHTSRLLPTYGFPVGLDIVDRFAKVPAWMSHGVRGQHQIVLLKKALESGDPRAVAYAKRVLAARGRDWLFRPTA